VAHQVLPEHLDQVELLEKVERLVQVELQVLLEALERLVQAELLVQAVRQEAQEHLVHQVI
jgi:hypothetical protein